MRPRALRDDSLLLLTAAIWGFAFVAQRIGMEHVGPFAFNGVRFALGSVSLLPLILVRRRVGVVAGEIRGARLLVAGMGIGAVLFIAASLQQIGIVSTTAGKAGFITGLYVVLVPLAGLAWGQRAGWGRWAGALLAAIGLYFLSVTERLTVERGDLLVLVSAFFWAAHVQLVGLLAPRTDSLVLAALQFAACSLLSLGAAALSEDLHPEALLRAAAPILYGGLGSVGVAYTLQIVVQRTAHPTHAAILLSLEGVFAALGGALVLGESLSVRGLAGCALMLAGMLASQITAPGPRRARGNGHDGTEGIIEGGSMKGKCELVEVSWPEFGRAQRPPEPDAAELSGRVEALRAGMRARGLTHVVVYGDREHFANVTWLTGYDPRFEEALVVVGVHRDPLLVVGNEGEGYLPVSASYRSGALRAERFPTFSLLDQPRTSYRALEEILAGEGVGEGSVVGCAGWKYFGQTERPDAVHALEIPSFIADAIRDLAGRERVTNATDLFMNPRDGLRAVSGPGEIAFFEYTSILASEGMGRMLRGLREGMSDHELAALAGYNGEPLGCHMTLVSGTIWDRALSSPVGAPLRRGDPLAGNVCYWGANCCRAGWIAESAADLPAAAREYVEVFAGPYVEAMNAWFRALRVGATGDQLYRAIHDLLPGSLFGITLNPGHLIHLEEWLSSPVSRGSRIRLRSGMVMQSDVIPSSPVYGSSRMEDGLVLADEELREVLRGRSPALYARCLERRGFMREVLGLEVHEDVLPLSNIPGIVPPFLLRSERVLTIGR